MVLLHATTTIAKATSSRPIHSSISQLNNDIVSSSPKTPMRYVLAGNMLYLSFALGLLCSVAFAQDCSTTCFSYGLDIQDGGTYFQNSGSNANFTALEDFSGCQAVDADNVLVDPEGNQYFCNDTPMTPDKTQQQIICSVTKNQLTSGQWSIIVLSNNGQCAPIDYIRTFQLNVGPQVTSRIPLTITITSTSAPATSTTITYTETITSTARTVTTAVSGAYAATRTITPLFPPVTLTTRALITLTQTETTTNIVATSTRSRACPTTAAPTARVADAVNLRISITISGLRATGGLLGLLADLLPRETGLLPAAANPSAQQPTGFIKHQRGALHKRGPDVRTITIQDGAAGTSTFTSIITAPLTTVSVTSLVLTTVGVTATATSNVNASKTVTTTAPVRTNTLTLWVPLSVVTTRRTERITAVVNAAPTNC